MNEIVNPNIIVQIHVPILILKQSDLVLSEQGTYTCSLRRKRDQTILMGIRSSSKYVNKMLSVPTKEPNNPHPSKKTCPRKSCKTPHFCQGSQQVMFLLHPPLFLASCLPCSRYLKQTRWRCSSSGDVTPAPAKISPLIEQEMQDQNSQGFRANWPPRETRNF